MRNLFLAAILLQLLAPAALACSVAPNYRVPTNFELVEAADLIVLGRVDDFRKKDPARLNQVAIKPVKTFKGKAPGEPLTVRGSSTGTPDVTTLERAHPSVLWGSCTRTTFSRRTLVIALFKQTPEGFRALDFPFARNIEDVDSKFGLWVRAVEIYVKLLAVPAAERRAAIEAEARRLDAEFEDRTASIAIARDLRAYLSAVPAN